MALETLAGFLQDADLLHFVDNTSALSGFIGGSASSEDSAAIFAIFHVQLMRLNIRYWAEHVESKANVADGPSRIGEDCPVAKLLRCRFLPVAFPSFFDSCSAPLQYLKACLEDSAAL